MWTYRRQAVCTLILETLNKCVTVLSVVSKATGSVYYSLSLDNQHLTTTWEGMNNYEMCHENTVALSIAPAHRKPPNEIRTVSLSRSPSFLRLWTWRGCRTSPGSSCWPWRSPLPLRPFGSSCCTCSSSSSVCHRGTWRSLSLCPTAPWSAGAGAGSPSCGGTWARSGRIATASRWWRSRIWRGPRRARRRRPGSASRLWTVQTRPGGSLRSTGRGRELQTSGIWRFCSPGLWLIWWAPAWRGLDTTGGYPWRWRRSGKVQSRQEENMHITYTS